MSKASQRRESERQKRLQKQTGVRPELLSELLRSGRYGQQLDEVLLWKCMADAGKKRKAHEDDAMLNAFMDRHRASIEVITSGARGMTVDASYADEPSDMPVPGYAILESSSGRENTLLMPMSTISRPLEPSAEEMVQALFNWARATSTQDVLIWVFGSSGELFPTFCLGMTRSGARAARILIQGKWIIAKNVHGIWFKAMEEIASDLGEFEHPEEVAAAEVLVKLGELLPQLPDLTEVEQTKLYDAIRTAFGMAQEPLVGLMSRLAAALMSAQTEASDIWTGMETGERDFDAEIRGAQKENARLQAALERESRQVVDLKHKLMTDPEPREHENAVQRALPSLAEKMSAFF